MGLSAVLVDFSVRFYLSRGVDVIFRMHISRLIGKDINFMYGEVDFLLDENINKKNNSLPSCAESETREQVIFVSLYKVE